MANGFETYSTDKLIRGEVRYSKNELMTVANTVVYIEGTILARSTATLKLIPYVKGGSTAGNGVPKYVLATGFTATASGDVKVNAIKWAGNEGLDFAQMVIQADTDNSNITSIVLDELRVYNIQVETFSEQSVV